MRAKVVCTLIVVVSMLGWATAARASIAVTLTGPQQSYVPGVDNTFTFDVNVTNVGVEFVDRFEFVFPTGFTIVSGTPASGTGTCLSNDGIQSICSPSISWVKTSVPCTGAFSPTGCGVYTTGDFVFTVTASVPSNFSGPLVVTLNSSGDGFGPTPHTDSDSITFALAENVPTASTLGLGVLALLLAGAAIVALRRFA
jgi:hypothetical protein